MHKRPLLFLSLALLLMPLGGCSEPSDYTQFNALLEQMAKREEYAFHVEGDLALASGANVDTTVLPQQYIIDGSRSDGQLFADIQYFDETDTPLFGIELQSTDDTAWISVAPLYQYVFDYAFSESSVDYIVTDALGEQPWLSLTGWDSQAILPSLTDLLESLEPELVESRLTEADGVYSLIFSADEVSEFLSDYLAAVSLPSEILQRGGMPDLHDYDEGEASGVIESQFLIEAANKLAASSLSDNVFTCTLSYDSETDSYTQTTALTIPDMLTISARAVITEAQPQETAEEENILSPQDSGELLTDYVEANRRAAYLLDMGVKVVADLPEIKLSGHQLEDSAVLTGHDIEIGDISQTISLIQQGEVVTTDSQVYNFTTGMTLLYTYIPSSSASQAMTEFVTEDIDLSGYDGESFELADIRVNEEDTSAVMAMSYDDNHMGHSVYIFMLQNIEDTGTALLMNIVILVDSLNENDMAALNELSTNIGLDFSEYISPTDEE